MIDPAAIRAYDFGSPEQAYRRRDAILYALGVGLGCDPCDAEDLRFLDERSLAVLPTFAVTLCSPGQWIREPALGVDFTRLVHFAQSARFLAPLTPEGAVRGTAQIVSLTDRGEGRGALLVLERGIFDAKTGQESCRLQQTLLLRSDGGFGGEPAAREARFAPDVTASSTYRYQTSPRAALIYRLSGDWNPLHLDPEIARGAGFPRPILHGLASYAIAGVAVSRACGRDPVGVTHLACKFIGIVVPGDDLLFEVWDDGADAARFRAKVGERIVLDDGRIEWGAR